MILKLSYQQKLKSLPWVLLAGILLVYWIAISGTVTLKRNCKELRNQMISAGDAPAQLVSLTSRLNDFNAYTGNSQKDRGGDPLLNFFSTNSSSDADLIDFLPLHAYARQPYLIETRIAIFEGNYSSLITVLFTLEKNYPSGKVVSVKFETETNLKTQKKRLLMTLYIQSISNDKNPAAYDKTNPKS
jgi:hypothetical protein